MRDFLRWDRVTLVVVTYGAISYLAGIVIGWRIWG